MSTPGYALADTMPRSLVGSIAFRLVAGLLRMLALLFAVLLAVPVMLLPGTTAVPAPLWLLLAFCDLGLVVLAFRFALSKTALLGLLAGVTIVSLIAVVASQWFAVTPPIVDAHGSVIPGSIATLEQVSLGGSQQWITIRGKSTHNPVLLFLAGGPGGSQLSTTRHTLSGLEDHFVVVNWDQPGAGKSFDAVNRSTLTPARYTSDGHELVLYLRQRFGVDKVYVLGESWGSALGIMLVQRYPELFYAFIGTGQMVAFTETDVTCYEFALRWAQERGDTAKVEQLRSQGPPPYYGDGVAMKQANYLLDTFNYMNDNPQIYEGFNTLADLASPEFGLYDKVNWVRGVLDTLGIVYPQLWTVDFRTQAVRLDLPVYFLIGRYDINAPTIFTEQYYALLTAPHKEIVWFEHSGHNPWVTESARFVDVMVQTVLTQTQPAY